MRFELTAIENHGVAVILPPDLLARLGMTELFIELNGKKLLATNQQLIDLFLRIAASEVT